MSISKPRLAPLIHEDSTPAKLAYIAADRQLPANGQVVLGWVTQKQIGEAEPFKEPHATLVLREHDRWWLYDTLNRCAIRSWKIGVSHWCPLDVQPTDPELTGPSSCWQKINPHSRKES